MPDHFHVLLTVGSDITIERAVQYIKGGFSFRAGKALGIRPPVWQKGFSEVRITGLKGFLKVQIYIRNNPVARCLVANPEDYLYSSAHPGFELDPVPSALETSLSADVADWPSRLHRNGKDRMSAPRTFSKGV
jgi:putative transposase